MKLHIHPLTADRWDDFEALFGANGACGGCWCQWFLLPNKIYETQKGEGNRQAMRQIVESGAVPGLLAYHEGQPIGWVAVAPRKDYSRLQRSRILRPVDDQPV